MKLWQALAYWDTGELLEVARAAEDMGFHGVTVPDHLFHPARASRYPYTTDGERPWGATTPWPDPWVTIGAMSAVTRRLVFSTAVYVAPARDLFTVAKAVSTAAVLSGGRVRLGVGAGWCAEEFQQTGQDFASRGPRLTEMVPVLRALLTGEPVTHKGTHFSFEDVQISPVPPEPVPVYFGGHTDAALRRAVRLGDGWIGVFTEQQEADRVLAALRRELRAARRERDDFEVVVSLRCAPSPELFQRYAGLGATGFVAPPRRTERHPTLHSKIEAMKHFAACAQEGLRGRAG